MLNETKYNLCSSNISLRKNTSQITAVIPWEAHSDPDIKTTELQRPWALLVWFWGVLFCFAFCLLGFFCCCRFVFSSTGIKLWPEVCKLGEYSTSTWPFIPPDRPKHLVPSSYLRFTNTPVTWDIPVPAPEPSFKKWTICLATTTRIINHLWQGSQGCETVGKVWYRTWYLSLLRISCKIFMH